MPLIKPRNITKEFQKKAIQCHGNFYGSDTFSMVILSTKKQCSIFLKGFRFLENLFQIKVLKTFKVSSICHIKTCRSLKRKAILDFPSTVC